MSISAGVLRSIVPPPEISVAIVITSISMEELGLKISSALDTSVKPSLEKKIQAKVSELLQNKYDKEEAGQTIDFSYSYEKNPSFEIKFNNSLSDVIVNITTKQLVKYYNFSILNYNDNVPSPIKFTNLRNSTSQTVIPKEMMQNAINYAILKKGLDFKLKKNEWKINYFKFYSGDLFEIIPKLHEKYFPDEIVEGECNVLGVENFKVLIYLRRVKQFNSFQRKCGKTGK